MGYVERKTHAVFEYFVGQQIENTRVDVPPGERDPELDVLGGHPLEAISVRFSDYVVAEVEDPETGDPIICTSEQVSGSGRWFYRGVVASRTMVDEGAVKFPLLIQQNVPTIMGTGNHVIYFDGGQVILPYDPTMDMAVGSPRYFQETHGIPADNILGPQTKKTWMEKN